MASFIRSVGGLLKYFYQALWLVDLNADVIGQSINRRGVASEFPRHVTVSSSFSARFLYGFPYIFQRAWTVLCSTKHPLEVVRVGTWNSLGNFTLDPGGYVMFWLMPRKPRYPENWMFFFLTIFILGVKKSNCYIIWGHLLWYSTGFTYVWPRWIRAFSCNTRREGKKIDLVLWII